MKRILIIEDDRDIVELVRYNLANEGFQVSAASDGSSWPELTQEIASRFAACSISCFPNLSGLDICREIRRTNP